MKDTFVARWRLAAEVVRRCRTLAVGVTVASVVACGSSGGDGTAPVGRTGVRIIAGNGSADTVLATPSQPLVVEVRDSTGAPAPNLQVNFVGAPKPTPQTTEMSVETVTFPAFGPFTSVLTDANGHASVIVRMGTTAGPARIAILVPRLASSDTARFTIIPGAATHIVSIPSDTAVLLASTFPYRTVPADQFGNLRPGDPLTWSVSSPAVSITGSGSFAASAVGAYTVTATNGKVTGTATVIVVPLGRVVGEMPFQIPFAVVDMNGANKHVLTDVVNGDASAHPAWMPDGVSVVYTTLVNGIQVLKIMDMAGAVRPVFPSGIPNVTNMTDPTPTADGKWLYFSAADTRCGVAYCFYRSKIDGSSPELIGNAATAGGTHPSPSPDGSRVAFQSATGIRVFDVASKTVSTWAVPGLNPVWSPDGSRIAFFASGTIGVVNPDGTGVTTLSRNGARTYTGNIGWSPDGRYVIATTLFAPLDLIDTKSSLVLSLPTALTFTVAAMR